MSKDADKLGGGVFGPGDLPREQQITLAMIMQGLADASNQGRGPNLNEEWLDFCVKLGLGTGLLELLRMARQINDDDNRDLALRGLERMIAEKKFSDVEIAEALRHEQQRALAVKAEWMDFCTKLGLGARLSELLRMARQIKDAANRNIALRELKRMIAEKKFSEAEIAEALK